MKIFKDRKAAGELLAKRLKKTKADLVLGIPRGGVVVAAAVAKLLSLPLDIVITRKIGASYQEELALGAVDPDGQVVWEEELIKELDLKIENLKLKINDEMEEIKRRECLYRQGRGSLNVTNKVVILVDDGMATGVTVLSAVRYFKRHKAEIILAIPVASREALQKVEHEVKQIIVLETPGYFQSVGQFYHEFEEVSDEEVVYLLSS